MKKSSLSSFAIATSLAMPACDSTPEPVRPAIEVSKPRPIQMKPVIRESRQAVRRTTGKLNCPRPEEARRRLEYILSFAEKNRSGKKGSETITVFAEPESPTLMLENKKKPGTETFAYLDPKNSRFALQSVEIGGGCFYPHADINREVDRVQKIADRTKPKKKKRRGRRRKS